MDATQITALVVAITALCAAAHQLLLDLRAQAQSPVQEGPEPAAQLPEAH